MKNKQTKEAKIKPNINEENPQKQKAFYICKWVHMVMDEVVARLT